MSDIEKPTLLIATEGAGYSTAAWAHEGYDIRYIPNATDRSLIEDVVDGLETGDKYAIIAFGAAALAALSFALSPSRNLVALAAYYPPSLPSSIEFHPSVKVLLHLPHTTNFSPASTPLLTTRIYDPPAATPFAEPEYPLHYDPIATDLAFTRTLALLRLTLGGGGQDLEQLMDTCESVREIYSSGRARLVSRTVGVDRVVDEIVVGFEEGREVGVVCVVKVRHGEVVSERCVWDLNGENGRESVGGSGRGSLEAASAGAGIEKV